MCYDIAAKKSSYIKQALRFGYNESEIEQMFNETSLPIYHASGFSHPILPIFSHSKIIPAVWGLLPFWAKDRKLMNKTLNARSETLHEKNAYKNVVNNRCIIVIDGFFEHHHYNGLTYPFYISHTNKEPIFLAGLFSNWTDNITGEIICTFTIITTKANSLLQQLHNNPKLSFGPRMPLILNNRFAQLWLQLDLSKQDINSLFQSYPSNALQYYTVRRLRGKAYIGNVPEILEPVIYPELVFNV